MRNFELLRPRKCWKTNLSVDVAVAEGCIFASGTVCVVWSGTIKSVVVHDSIDNFIAISGQGESKIRYISETISVDSSAVKSIKEQIMDQLEITTNCPDAKIVRGGSLLPKGACWGDSDSDSNSDSDSDSRSDSDSDSASDSDSDISPKDRESLSQDIIKKLSTKQIGQLSKIILKENRLVDKVDKGHRLLDSIRALRDEIQKGN
jgi:hypothetical protein